MKGTTFSAAILLAGYIIGTGYYAIPVAAGPAGFYPATLAIALVWLYILATGLLYMETILIHPEGANLTTISRNIIGWSGMLVAVATFLTVNLLFISNFYTISIDIFTELTPLAKGWLFTLITLLFGGVVFWGSLATIRLNFILFMGFLLAFAATVFLASNGVQLENLANRQWFFIAFSVPIIVTAFDYQSMLPTVATYLKRDAKQLVTALIIALLFPLAVYIAWSWVTIGSTSRGVLWEAFETESSRIYSGFKILSGTAHFRIVFLFMSLFAIITSFITTGLALVDFLSDAFKIPLEKRVGKRRFYACLGAFGPGLLMSLFIPAVVASLEPLLGWAELIFNGIIPIWLATRARYILKLEMHHLLPGGKPMLILLSIATFFLIYLEGVHLLNQ